MSENYPRRLTDTDVIAIQEELQRAGLRRISKSTVQDALALIAQANRFHPVRDYLEALGWDQETRIRGWLSRYLGVEGSPYADEIGRLFLIALIARVMQPGCKADYMLILEGPQGQAKSTACNILVGDWFSDNLPDLARGDAVRLSMHLRGKWLIEIAEMSSFSAAESHTLKEFLTQTHERFTPKYGRHEVVEPRQCLFVGTTNEGTYLKDATGSRRFWPVKVGTIDIDALRKDRDQLLAEAMQEYLAGARWWPDREFEKAYIVPEQAARFDEDPWHHEIAHWLSVNAIERCTVTEILKGALSLDLGKCGTREQRRARDVLIALNGTNLRSNGKTWFVRPKSGVWGGSK